VNLAHAQWFEATGSAPLLSDNKESARNLAVQDALKQALLFSGAQVKSIAQVSNGLLASDHFEVRSEGSVRDLQLISESHTDSQILVSIRVDIVPQDMRCASGNTLTKLVMTKFPIRHRQQAALGGIFNLGQATANQLFNILANHQGSYRATKLLNIEQNIVNQLNVQHSFPSPVQILTQSADAQYLLTGELVDLSMHNPQSKWYGLSTHDPKRQFELSMTLYDGNNSEKIWSKNYVTQGRWGLDKTQTVDVNSSKFWTAPYGVAISAILLDISSDLNQELFCAELKGNVVRIDNQQLTINLGSTHGIKVGDTFSVSHNQQFIDNNGIVRQSLVLNGVTLIAQQVNRNHTIVDVGDKLTYGDINLNDIVKKQ